MHLHILEMRKSGNTVCNNPDRQNHCKCPGACSRMCDQHESRHNSKDSGHQRNDRSETCNAFHLHIKDNVSDSTYNGDQSTKDYDPCEHTYRLTHDHNAKNDQNQSHDQFKPSDIRLSFHCHPPPLPQLLFQLLLLPVRHFRSGLP